MVKAAKSYAPGDLISHSPRPVAHALDVQCKGSFCDHCIKPLAEIPKDTPPDESNEPDGVSKHGEVTKLMKAVTCEGCKQMFYCSEACKKADWEAAGHQLECPIYQKINFLKAPAEEDNEEVATESVLRSYANRYLLRLWLLMRADRALRFRPVPLPTGGERCLDDLMWHPDKISSDMLEYVEQIYENFKELGITDDDEVDSPTAADAECLMNKDFLIRLHAQSFVNVFSLSQHGLMATKEELEAKSDGVTGMALFLAESVFDHSCRPNALWNLDGATISIRAATAIAEGEEIFVSYIAAIEATETRRSQLDGYHFTCQCDRCEKGPETVYVPPKEVFSPTVAAMFEKLWADSLITRPRGEDEPADAEPDTRVDVYEAMGLMLEFIQHIHQMIDSDDGHGGIECLVEARRLSIESRVRMLRDALVTFLDVIRTAHGVYNYHLAGDLMKKEIHIVNMDGIYNDLSVVVRELYTAHKELSFEWKVPGPLREATRLSLKELEALRNVLRRAARTLAVNWGQESEVFKRFVDDIWMPVCKEDLDRKYGPGAAEKALQEAASQWIPPVGIAGPSDPDYIALMARVPPALKYTDGGKKEVNAYQKSEAVIEGVKEQVDAVQDH